MRAQSKLSLWAEASSHILLILNPPSHNPTLEGARGAPEAGNARESLFTTLCYSLCERGNEHVKSINSCFELQCFKPLRCPALQNLGILALYKEIEPLHILKYPVNGLGKHCV